MRIVTLIENLVYKQGLFAEHGLSFYIETGTKKILFDTGQGGNFLINAKNLGINIREINAVIISHGHYDHTGGLYPFLKVNSKATVYIKKEAFNRKFHGTERFIGVTYDPVLLDGRIKFVDGITEIDKDIFIMTDIPVRNPQDVSFHNFNIQTNDGYIKDEFDDELYLAITCNSQLSIISSCSHRGITNIIEAAVRHFNLPVNTIVGGFHIKNCKAGQFETITHCLERMSARSIGVCHCTGVEKYAELADHFKEKVFYNCTGNEVVIT